MKTLALDPSTENLQWAWEQLQQAEQLLKPIPVWSRHHGAARAELAEIEQRQDELRSAIAALSAAWEASQLSQDPPYPLETWEQLESIWSEAIEQLNQIDGNSVVYPLAQTKLQEYQDQLVAVQRRIVLEKRGYERIAAAQVAIEQAEKQQKAAKSLEDWQQVHTSWLIAIDSLLRVPPGTLSAATAQELLEKYQPERDQAQRQREREQTAKLLYDRATESADVARKALDLKQWDTSIARWQNAIGNLRQVPVKSAYAEEARTSLTAYTKALAQTIAAQELADKTKATSEELARFCAGTPTICSYTVSPERIIVRLRREYLAQVQTLDKEVAQNPNSEVRQQLTQHLQTTIDSLETLSDNAGIPLEVVDPAGKRLGQYAPQL